jgi:GTPase SAR1 family protein
MDTEHHDLETIHDVSIPRDEKSGLSIVMIASTRAGKTFLLKHIVHNFFKDHIKILFSDSLQSDVYKELEKDCVSAPMYIPRLLKEAYKIQFGTKNKYEFLFITDDVVNNKNDEEIKKMLTIYRNSRMSCILCAQSTILLNSIGRNNVNILLFGKCNSQEGIEQILKKFIGAYFPSEMKLIDKVKYYRELTKDHCFLMLNNLEGTIQRIRLTLPS